MPSLFISHLQSQAWSGDVDHDMGGIKRETAVIIALTYTMHDLMVLSTWAKIMDISFCV